MDPDESYQKYVETYVIIHSPSKPSSAGKLLEIRDGNALLSPHMSARCHPKKGPIRGLTSKIETVSLLGADISPTTERSLRAYCFYQNKENGSKKKDIDPNQKIK